MADEHHLFATCFPSNSYRKTLVQCTFQIEYYLPAKRKKAFMDSICLHSHNQNEVFEAIQKAVHLI